MQKCTLALFFCQNEITWSWVIGITTLHTWKCAERCALALFLCQNEIPCCFHDYIQLTHNFIFQHMIRYRYIPFTSGKPKYAKREEDMSAPSMATPPGGVAQQSMWMMWWKTKTQAQDFRIRGVAYLIDDATPTILGRGILDWVMPHPLYSGMICLFLLITFTITHDDFIQKNNYYGRQKVSHFKICYNRNT